MTPDEKRKSRGDKIIKTFLSKQVRLLPHQIHSSKSGPFPICILYNIGLRRAYNALILCFTLLEFMHISL